MMVELPSPFQALNEALMRTTSIQRRILITNQCLVKRVYFFPDGKLDLDIKKLGRGAGSSFS